MKTLLLIILFALLAVNVTSAEPINTACTLPPLSAGVLTTWNAAAATITDTVLTSEQIAAWLSVGISPTVDDYYEQRNHSMTLFRVVVPSNVGTDVTLWIIVSWRTGKYYAILTDGVIAADGYVHPCGWGTIQYSDLPL